MTVHHGIRRKAHFLGTKIKGLRKRNNLTLEDLSVRCVQIDAEAGPSVSYLSMIENGKRTPSQRLLEIIAEIFQKDPNWFYDESLEEEAIELHLIAMSSRPPIFYWTAGTIAVLRRVRAMRREGLSTYATIDAGPNVHVICPTGEEEDVSSELEAMSEVELVITDRVGSGPSFSEDHLG